MKVTCAFCKAKIEKKDSFSVKNNKNNTYYCSELHYQEKIKQSKHNSNTISSKEKEEYDAIFEQTKKIFGYNFQSYAILRKEIKNLEKLADRSKILSYLKENEDFLSNLLNKKEFSNDFGRIRYYSTVIASKLHDYNPTNYEYEKINVDCEIYEPVVSKKKKRRSLVDLENGVI